MSDTKIKYSKLKDICIDNFWIMPSTPKYVNEGIPYLTSKNIKNGKINICDVNYISETDYKNISNNRTIQSDDILLSMIGTIGEIAIVNENDLPFYGQNMYLLRLNTNIVNVKYFYYFYKSSIVQKKLLSGKNQGTQGYLRTKNIEELVVPIPSLAEQNKIVEILDKFENRIDIIKKQIDSRLMQFEYYANKILFKKDFNKVLIGDVCTITKGKTPIQKATPGDYPLVVTTSERKSCDNYQFDTSAVCIPLVSSRGHGIASLNHVYYQNGKFALGNILCALETIDNKKLNIKYLYYYLEKTKDYTLVPLMKGGANVSLHMDDILKVKISLPTIDKQEEIIKQFDTFDKISNVMKVKLDLCYKQYEYYRNKLLSFEELSVSE